MSLSWQGDPSFLVSGKCTWEGLNGVNSIIQWSFNRYTEPSLPFVFSECRMSGFDTETYGYGIDEDNLLASQKSFGEAWERLWFKSYKKQFPADTEPLSSNGFAAGKTNEQALKSSKCELLERAILQKAWSEKKGWNTSKIRHLKNKFLQIGFALKGWKTELYDIKSNIGMVKTCLAKHSDFGSIFDSCYVVDENVAESKVFFSVIKTSYFTGSNFGHKLEEIGTPNDHQLFYQDPKNSAAFAFLNFQNPLVSTIQLEGLNLIQQKLLTSAGSFPAVARSHNEAWPSLCWGKQSITGANVWPHPLA